MQTLAAEIYKNEKRKRLKEEEKNKQQKQQKQNIETNLNYINIYAK